MSLYQTVKSAITVRQVGEMYGMEPDRHGMVCCPFFHSFGSGDSDKTDTVAVVACVQKSFQRMVDGLPHVSFHGHFHVRLTGAYPYLSY